MAGGPGSRREAVAFAAVGALAVAFALHRMEDFDVWYHLAAGRLAWSTGRWPAVNTFAFTAPDHPWIDLHWLFQLVLYGVYRLGGIDACIALAAALVFATAGILYALARRGMEAAPAAVLLAATLTIASPRFVPRPELVSFVLFAAYLWLLERNPEGGRAVWLLVPLQVLWTNVQGIFAVGLALIGCYWLGATLAFLPLPRGWRAPSRLPIGAWRRLTIVLVLATVGCLLNPYGRSGALFPLELLPRVTGSSFLSQRIGEFRAPFESGYAPPLTYAWAGLLVLGGLLTVLNVRRWHLGRTLAFAAFAVLGSRSLRNMAFSTWIAVPVIAGNLDGALATVGLGGTRAGRAWWDARPRTRRVLAAAQLGLIAVLIAAVVTNRYSRALGVEREFGLGVSRARFSLEAVDFLREAGVEGRPFNCLAMGGFLAWHRHPAEQVFVDGRLEAFPEAVLRTYFTVMDDPRRWPALAAEQNFDYAFLLHLWGNRLPLATYLAGGHGWTLVYYDAIASIFVPTDEAHREVRERAQRTFAEVARRRGDVIVAAPLATPLVAPVADVWRGRALGNFLSALGDHAQAARVLERTLARDPEQADVGYALGVAHWYTGARADAVRAWQGVLQHDPTYEPARRALAESRR